MFKKIWNRFLASLMIQEKTDSPTLDPQQLSSTLNAIPDLMFELDADGRHFDFRALRPELLVAPPEQLLGYTVSEVMPAEAAERVMLGIKEASLNGYVNGIQILLPTALGELWFEVSMAKKQPSDGESERFIVLSRDITERKEKELNYEKMAFTDGLTGLPNRLLFEKRLQLAMQSCEQSGSYCAVLFLDLDNFKLLNDEFGHGMGDKILINFAKRLQTCVRTEDFISRWGGDEFGIIIETLSSYHQEAQTHITSICNQLVDQLEAPYNINDHTLYCHVSIGVRLFNSIVNKPSDVLKQADKAMYATKRQHGSTFKIA